MPIAAVAGLPWLAGILGSLFTGIVGFFVQFFTKRLAIVVAGVAIIVTLTAGLFTALEGLLSGLTYIVPTEISAGAALVTPSNLTACISIIISAKMLRYAYDWNVKVLQYKMKI